MLRLVPPHISLTDNRIVTTRIATAMEQGDEAAAWAVWREALVRCILSAEADWCCTCSAVMSAWTATQQLVVSMPSASAIARLSVMLQGCPFVQSLCTLRKGHNNFLLQCARTSQQPTLVCAAGAWRAGRAGEDHHGGGPHPLRPGADAPQTEQWQAAHLSSCRVY